MPRSMSARSTAPYEPDGEPHVLIEANIGEGVTSAPLSKYFSYHTRVCRPVGLSYEDRTTVCRYAINRIGFGYDTKNIVDLMRFLIPLPIPQRWRRRMIAFGSGDPTKIICSALIAQAFDAVRYPILPKITQAGSRARPPRDPAHPRFLALHAARLRHLALFRNRQTHHRARLRLHRPALGRQAEAARGGSGRIRCVSRRRLGRRRLFLKRLTKTTPVPAEEVSAQLAEMDALSSVLCC